MRVRTIVVIAIIDMVIILFGVLFVAIQQTADIPKTVAIVIGSMLALTFGIVWAEARAGYIPKLRGHTVPLAVAFALSALYTAILADGAHVAEGFEILFLAMLSLGAGVAAFIFATDKLEKGLERIKAPEWIQAIIPAFLGLVVLMGVTFGVIMLISYLKFEIF